MTRKRTSENELGLTGSPARRKATSRTRTKLTPSAVEVSAPSVPAEPEIASPQAAAAVTVYVPTREDIAELAYLYWESRGCQGGSSEADWLRAEQELRVRVIAPR